jgi:hypothetical protein
MKEALLIEKAIKKMPRQKIFFAESICTKYPIKTVKYVLAKLIQKNEIGTISHGMYFRPGKNRYFPNSPIPPGTDEIIKAVSKKTGEIISVHGAVALNQIGLSTQVPAHEIHHTTGRSRYIKVNGRNKIKLVHINPRKIVMPKTVICHVVTALWFEGKKYLRPLVIKKIHGRLGDKYFNEVLQHVDKMPVWMQKVFICYQNMKPDDPQLEEEDEWNGL